MRDEDDQGGYRHDSRCDGSLRTGVRVVTTIATATAITEACGDALGNREMTAYAERMRRMAAARTEDATMALLDAVIAAMRKTQPLPQSPTQQQ